jgi:hypothetical protein
MKGRCMRHNRKGGRNIQVEVDFKANPGLASDFNPASVVNLYLILPDVYMLNLRTSISLEDISKTVYPNQPIYLDMPYQKLSDIFAQGLICTRLDGQLENIPDRIDLETAIRSLRGNVGKRANMHEFELPARASHISFWEQNDMKPGLVGKKVDKANTQPMLLQTAWMNSLQIKTVLSDVDSVVFKKH